MKEIKFFHAQYCKIKWYVNLTQKPENPFIEPNLRLLSKNKRRLKTVFVGRSDLVGVTRLELAAPRPPV